MRVRRCTMLALLALLVPLLSPAFAQTNVQLVLDASGSMFVRLDDGRYRIVAAKDALTDLIGRIDGDADLTIGLRVYGGRLDARHPDACSDSELVMPMGAFDREQLLRAVRDVQARGATPIAHSLALAGADLVPGERNVIVLVTDGEESCGGDPRAVLDELRARGIEVEVHIVGIDLGERAAASFESLGAFVNARNATELAGALTRAMSEVATPAAATYLVRARVTRGGEDADGVAVRLVPAVGGEAGEARRSAVGRFELHLPAGAFVAVVDDVQAAETHTFAGITVTPEGDNEFVFEIAPQDEVTMTVSPGDPVAGASVEIRYALAPGGDRDWITVVPVDAPDEAFMAWSYVDGREGSLALRIPEEPGALEARYHHALPEGGTRVIGRSDAFTSTAAAVSLDAPAEVGAGATFEVRWTGPDNVDDYLTVVPAGAPEGSYLSYAYTRRGNPVALTAPLEPGSYEVRYSSDTSSGRTFASVPLTVVAQSYSIEGPADVGAGTEFEVRWVGPDNHGDYLTIVPVDAPVGAYASYAYTRSGNPARLRAPLEAGRYELRYSTEAASPNPVLARSPITVTAQRYSLEVPAEIGAGTRFEVRWSGPDAPGEYVTIVPEGAPVGSYRSYAYTRAGNPAVLDAPTEAGRYEVRYSTEAASPNPTLASVTVVVTAMAIVLEAPDTVAAGSAFEVRWRGPDGASDYVTIVPAGAPDGSYTSYAYTSDGPVLTLVAPDEPGAYELRYASDRVAGTFARRSITVR